MAKPEKVASVAEIKERLENHDIAIATKYIGINVTDVTELRRRLRETGVEYKVYKNNLARRALRELELENVADFMEGPTAWAFSNDPVAPAKILREFGKKTQHIGMVGGVLDGRAITAEQLKSLATLPSRDELLSQVVGTIAAPLRKLAGTLNAVPRNLVSVIDQIQKKKAEEEAA